MSDKVISSTTQEFLDVYDIVNDMVLLKDGTAAVILQIGTMNFSLLAEQEQDAVIFTYGSLLNSLNYPIQINIQSQTKDATKYLRLLDEQITKASSDRKATLIKKYRDFVAALIKERNVLQKRFYIIVPASPGEMGLITPSSVLPGKTTFDISTVEKSILLEKAANILEPRKDHLTSQFNRLGLYVRQLSTQEIIQNFYINYNPEAAEGQEISSSENYTTPLVRASFGGKFMQTTNQPNGATQNQAASSAQISMSPTPEEIISGNPATAPMATTSAEANPIAADPIAATAPIVDTTPIAAPIIAPIVEEKTTTPVSNESIELPSNTIDPENIPTAAMPSPQNILSSVDPAAAITEPVVAQEVQSSPVESMVNASVPADVSTLTPASTPAIGNIFEAEQTIAENSQPIPNTVGQNNTEQAVQAPAAELDLKLDAGLIDSNFSEPEPDLTQNFMEESVSEKAPIKQADNQPEQENKPTELATETPAETQEVAVETPATPAVSNEPPSDFAEEITPLQNKFESQVKTD